MTDIFISYSRKDEAFGRKLYQELTEIQKRQVWMDWREIPQAEAWWRSIRRGIEESDNFVLIVTPDSLASPVCNLEILHAREHHKRIIPILYRDFDAAAAFGLLAARKLTDFEEQVLNKRDIIVIARDNWQEISSINFLDFKEGREFDFKVRDLLEALDTDITYISQHTTLQQRAIEWYENGQKTGFLLRETALIEAEAWLVSGRGKKPPPTDLHAAYIQTSRDMAVRQQRTLIGSLTFGLVVALSLAASTYILFQQSESSLSLANERGTRVAQQAATSDRRADEARSLSLASGAEDEIDTGNLELALALAVEANQIASPSFQARRALYAASDSQVRDRFEGHRTRVLGAAFSPDGLTAISGGCLQIQGSCSLGLGELFLWEVATGELIRRFEGFTGGIMSVAFSPDGQTAISGGCANTERQGACQHGEVILWDLATGGIRQRFDGYTSIVGSVAFSPDGQAILAGSDNGELILWDVATEKMKHRFNGHSSDIYSVAFSPNGQTAISISNQAQLFLWDIETGKLLRQFDGLNIMGSQPSTIAFSPDGQTALTGAGSLDDRVILWDVTTGDILRRFSGHTDTVLSVAFSPDGQTALSGSFDGTLILWDVATGLILGRYTGHTGAVQNIAFSPDGQDALSSSGSELILWDLNMSGMIGGFNGHMDSVLSVAFSPDGQTAISGSLDNTLILWDVATSSIRHQLDGNVRRVWRAVFSPDGLTALASSDDGEIVLWDMTTGTIRKRFNGNTERVRTLAFSPTGQTALAGSDDGELILWDIVTGVVLHRFSEYFDTLSSVAFSPDGQLALVGSNNGGLTMLDVTTGEIVRHFAGHTGVVYSVTFSPDGQLGLSGASDATLILWDLMTGETLRRFEGHSGVVRSVVFGPDGLTAFSGGCHEVGTYDSCISGELILWDIATGELLRRFNGHVESVWSVALSPDGETALSGSCGKRTSASCRSGELILWRVLTAPGSLLHWLENNRYVPELTCEQRTLYGTDVQCDATGVFPTRTPFLP